MCLAQVNMHGANVVSWKRPDGSNLLHLRPDSPMDGVQPILCAFPFLHLPELLQTQ